MPQTLDEPEAGPAPVSGRGVPWVLSLILLLVMPSGTIFLRAHEWFGRTGAEILCMLLWCGLILLFARVAAVGLGTVGGIEEREMYCWMLWGLAILHAVWAIYAGALLSGAVALSEAKRTLLNVSGGWCLAAVPVGVYAALRMREAQDRAELKESNSRALG